MKAKNASFIEKWYSNSFCDSIIYRIKSVVGKFSDSVISGSLLTHILCHAQKRSFGFFDLSSFKIHHQMGRVKIGLSQNSIGWKFRANDASVAANRIIISKLWSRDGLLFFTKCRNFYFCSNQMKPFEPILLFNIIKISTNVDPGASNLRKRIISKCQNQLFYKK